MLENKNILKVLSLLLAIALWAFVLGEVNPTVKKTITNIPVEFTNVESLEERDLAMVTKEGYYVDIVVEGARSDVGKLEISDIQAVADLYGYKEGENHVSVDVTLPNTIDLEEVKTPEITVVLEDLISVSKPVTVEFIGTTAENTEASAVEVSPAQVEVKGAKSVVNKVDSVVVQIDATDLTEEVEFFNETPTAWTKKGKLIKDVSISASTVEVEAVLHYTKTVSLELKVTGNPEGDPEITIPKEVTVKGDAEALARVTSISADSVDISDITETELILLDLTLPYGIELADISKDIGVKINFD